MGYGDMADVKKWTSFQAQLEKLVERGCIVNDRKFCIDTLKRVNYYRLTAYFLPFRESDGRYKPGTTFEKVYGTYEFDRKMRTILFSAIEEIEIFLRAQLAHYHAEEYGELGYCDPQHFSAYCNHDEFMNRFQAEVDRNDKLLFVKHHVGKYGGSFPLWAAVELFSFGTISFFYSNLKTQDQKRLLKVMYPNTPIGNKVLMSWLRCCTDLRNTCAHYSRLYHRIFPAQPKTPKVNLTVSNEFSFILQDRLFDMIYVLRCLYPKEKEWNGAILAPIRALIEQYETHIDLKHIGFPLDWEKRLER